MIIIKNYDEFIKLYKAFYKEEDPNNLFDFNEAIEMRLYDYIKNEQKDINKCDLCNDTIDYCLYRNECAFEFKEVDFI